MLAATIETLADTWIPTSGQVDEIIGKPMRLLVEVKTYDREMERASGAEIAQLSAEQKLFETFLIAFGEFARQGRGSVAIEFQTGNVAPKPALTEKQRQSIALVKKWMSEDRDEQTESMRRFMEAIDEGREGYRTLYKKK